MVLKTAPDRLVQRRPVMVLVWFVFWCQSQHFVQETSFSHDHVNWRWFGSNLHPLSVWHDHVKMAVKGLSTAAAHMHSGSFCTLMRNFHMTI